MSESATPLIVRPAMVEEAGLLSATSLAEAGEEGGAEFSGTQRFRVVKPLGTGGMGRVYEVIDTESGGRVALKLLRRLAPASILLFKTEFRALQDVSHENLISLGELFEENGQWFLTMELVNGQDFLSFVRGVSYQGLGAPPGEGATAATGTVAAATVTATTMTSEPMGRDIRPRDSGDLSGQFFERRLRGALRQLCQGLMALHGAHKVHRDIKPSNILVTTAGRVVLVDFGLVADWRQGVEQGLFGTISYMAPEQVDGKIGPATDWYSVGVLLYRALTGRLPYQGTEREILAAKRLRPPPPPSQWVKGLPADLEALCMALIRPKPEERPTGAEVWERLRIHERAAQPMPLDGLGEESGHSEKFWGRGAERQLWKEALAKARDGVGTSLFFEGESGVGKSALMQQCLRDSGDALVLSGRCYERESIRYKGVDGLVDALTAHLLTLPMSEVEAILPVRAQLLTQAFPVMGRVRALAEKRAVAFGDPVRQRAYTFAALRELLWRLAERTTLVLAIDDLQWADTDSLTLLSEVLRAPDAPPLLLVATVRTEKDKPSLAAQGLKGMGEVRRCSLGPLAPNEAQALARALVDDVDDDSFADEIAKESEGHPLFIAELMRHARHSVRGKGLSLDDALWGRVGRLPDAAQDVLKVVCIAGMPVLQSVVAEVVGTDSFPQLSSHLSLLRGGNLARTSGPKPNDTVQAYHDRVREAVTGHLDTAFKAEIHGKIALALERRAEVEPEALALHWREAGQPGKAAGYAAEAAGRAAASLAFDKAAALYKMALELSSDAPAVPRLRVSLADALVNLGRSFDAAREYLAAVAGLPPDETLDVKRRAADQLLRAGNVDEGLAVLRDVVKAVSITLPRTRAGTFASLLRHRLLLWLRGLRFRPANPEDIPPAEIRRLEVCWAIAVGLGMIDHIQGADFQARALLLSLRSGHSERIAVALAYEVIFRELEGHKSRRIAEVVLRESEQLSEMYASPYLTAWLELAKSVRDTQRGHHARGLGHARNAADLFRDHCFGAGWELQVADYALILCLRMMGRLTEMNQQVQDKLDEARARGNLRVTIQLQAVFRHYCHLLSDRPDLAKCELQQAMEAWVRPEYDLQHAYQYLASVDIALYEGAVQEGYTLEHEWRRYNGSTFPQSENFDAAAADARSRCMLAAAARKGPRWKCFLKLAEKFALRVARAETAVGRSFSAMLLAQVCYCKGEEERQEYWLRRAIDECQAADMLLYESACRWRLGKLLDNKEGATDVRRAEEYFAREAIARPLLLLRMLMPGYAPPVGSPTESTHRLQTLGGREIPGVT